MYRPFKDFVNAQLSDRIRSSWEGFDEVRSLARGGGLTARRKRPDGGAVYAFVTHVGDRDRFTLAVGWSRDPKFKAWDDVAWQQVHAGAPALARFRETARQAPATLWGLQAPGLLVANDLDPADTEAEIEVSAGVPWERLAAHARQGAEQEKAVRIFVDGPIVDSLLRGDLPPIAPANPSLGLHAPYPVKSLLVSWESWFDVIVRRPPEAAELAEIVGPALERALRQLDRLRTAAFALAQAPTA